MEGANRHAGAGGGEEGGSTSGVSLQSSGNRGGKGKLFEGSVPKGSTWNCAGQPRPAGGSTGFGALCFGHVYSKKLLYVTGSEVATSMVLRCL